jgi:anti-anti-sigma factor
MWNPFSRTSRRSPGDQPTAIGQRPSALSPPPTIDRSHRSSTAVEPTIENMAEIDRIGSITVVTFIPSELTHHRGGPQLADLLEELVAQGHRQLVFDIQNVMFMDSQCIGCLVHAMNELARQGGPNTGIALANPRSSVAHLFRITRLDRVFPICADVLAAVNVLERRAGNAA